MMPLVKTWHKGMIPFKDFPQEIHPERLWVLAQIPSPELLSIADVGCGQHKTLPNALGVDLVQGADVMGSLDDLPFPDAFLNVIISRHSLEHVLDPVRTLREWRRVIQPEGRVVVVLPDHGVVDTMQPILSSGMHLHAYDRESFSNLISATRWFNVVRLETVLEDWSFGAVLSPA